MRVCTRPYTLSVCTYMCICTYTYMFIRPYAQLSVTYIYTHIYRCMRRYVYIILYIHIKMDMYTRMPASVFVYVGFSVRAAVDV